MSDGKWTKPNTAVRPAAPNNYISESRQAYGPMGRGLRQRLYLPGSLLDSFGTIPYLCAALTCIFWVALDPGLSYLSDRIG